MLVLAADLDD